MRGQPVGTEAVVALHPLNCWQTWRTRATVARHGDECVAGRETAQVEMGWEK